MHGIAPMSTATPGDGQGMVRCTFIMLPGFDTLRLPQGILVTCLCLHWRFDLVALIWKRLFKT